MVKINPVKLVKGVYALNRWVLNEVTLQTSPSLKFTHLKSVPMSLPLLKVIGYLTSMESADYIHVRQILESVKKYGVKKDFDTITLEDFTKLSFVKEFGYCICSYLWYLDEIRFSVFFDNIEDGKKDFVIFGEKYRLLPKSHRPPYFFGVANINPFGTESNTEYVIREIGLKGEVKLSEIINEFPVAFYRTFLEISFSYVFLYYLFSGKMEKYYEAYRNDNTGKYFEKLIEFTETARSVAGINTFSEFLDFVGNVSTLV